LQFFPVFLCPDMNMKAIFFDFDGTIADTAPAVVLAMRNAFRMMGRDVPTEEQVRATIGLPLEAALAKLSGEDEAAVAELAATYRSQFAEGDPIDAVIYPGVPETLARLKSQGIRMAICTSRGFGTLDDILTAHGLKHYFETFITVWDKLPGKPAPDMVYALLDRMDLSKEDVLVVGDTTFDIEMGNKANCRTCAVTYGNHSRERLLGASPTYVVDDFASILQIID